MSTSQLYRIQADRDPTTGKVERLQIIDEIVAEDPTTGETVGTGRFVEPHRFLTRADRPKLFAELDALAMEAEARTAAKRQDFQDRKAAQEAERQAKADAEAARIARGDPFAAKPKEPKPEKDA